MCCVAPSTNPDYSTESSRVTRRFRLRYGWLKKAFDAGRGG